MECRAVVVDVDGRWAAHTFDSDPEPGCTVQLDVRLRLGHTGSGQMNVAATALALAFDRPAVVLGPAVVWAQGGLSDREVEALEAVGRLPGPGAGPSQGTASGAPRTAAVSTTWSRMPAAAR